MKIKGDTRIETTHLSCCSQHRGLGFSALEDLDLSLSSCREIRFVKDQGFRLAPWSDQVNLLVPM